MARDREEISQFVSTGGCTAKPPSSPSTYLLLWWLLSPGWFCYFHKDQILASNDVLPAGDGIDLPSSWHFDPRLNYLRDCRPQGFRRHGCILLCRKQHLWCHSRVSSSGFSHPFLSFSLVEVFHIFLHRNFPQGIFHTSVKSKKNGKNHFIPDNVNIHSNFELNQSQLRWHRLLWTFWEPCDCIFSFSCLRDWKVNFIIKTVAMFFMQPHFFKVHF